MRFSLAILLMVFLLLGKTLSLLAQDRIHCDEDIVSGQNLVYNGDFELGYEGFSIPSVNDTAIYNNRTAPYPQWSAEGTAWVHNNSFDFNATFSGSPESGDLFLMIDSKCEPGAIVWEQTVEVIPNTRYFFQTSIVSLHESNPAHLTFEINDELLSEEIFAPQQKGVWEQFVDSSWYSGSLNGEVTIRIRNSQDLGCDNGNDFALDNILFTAGCFFGEEGEFPELGDTLDLCGTEGLFTLEPKRSGGGNVYEYLWNTGDTTASIDVTLPGDYTVCMTTNGSCAKSDEIHVRSDFTIDLGEDYAICSEITDTLRADHFGPLVTYQWFKDGEEIPDATSPTFLPTELGTYAVAVTDGAGTCGTEIAEITLSQDTPNLDLGEDVALCSPPTALLDAGLTGTSYEWFFNDEPINDADEQTLEVNQIGTYSVRVTDALCDAVEASIEVTTLTFAAENGIICPNETTPSSTTLSISGYDGLESDYFWYTEAEGGTPIHNGVTFTTPGLTETTTYYVEDGTYFSGHVGPVDSLPCPGGWGDVDPNKYLVLEVTNELIIDSILVYPINTQSDFQIGIRITELNGSFRDSVIYFPNHSSLTGVDPLAHPTYVPMNMTLPPGTYRMDASGTDRGSLYYNQSCWSSDLPYTDDVGFLSIVDFVEYGNSMADGTLWTTQLWNGFYDIRYSSGIACDRVPVMAVFDSLKCSECTLPTEATVDTIDVSSICLGDSLRLVAQIEPEDDYLLNWYQDGTLLAQTGDTIYVYENGNYTYSIIDPSREYCRSNASDSIDISVTPPPPGTILLTGDENPICPDTEHTFRASSPDRGVVSFTWYVDDILQPEDADTLSRSLSTASEIKVVSVLEDAVCLENTQVMDSSTIDLIDIPTVEVALSTPDSVCPGEPFTLSATALPIENVTNYEWTVEGNTFLTTTNTTEASIVSSGTIGLKTQFEGLTCIDTTSAITQVDIPVKRVATPNIEASADANGICEADFPFTFRGITMSDAGIAPSFLWTQNNEIVEDETTQTFSTNEVVQGDQIQIGLISSLSCVLTDTVWSAPIEVDIVPTIETEISISLNGEPLACEGQELDFEASSSGDGAFYWFVNGALVESGMDSTFSRAAGLNDETVQVSFVPNAQCPDVDSLSSEIVSLTVTGVEVGINALNNGDFCEGLNNGYEVTNVLNGGDNPMFGWLVNGESIGITSDEFTSNTLAEGDLVQVVINSSDPNCPFPDTASATVGTLQLPVTPSISISDRDLCDGSDLFMNASYANGGTSPVFEWTLNGIPLEEDTSFTTLADLQDGDVLSVRLTSSLDCVTDSVATDDATISVHVQPVAEAGDDLLFDDFLEANFDGTGSTGSEVSYLWSSSDTLLEITNRNQLTGASAFPEKTATTFYLTVFNDHCADMDSMEVIVSIDLGENFPNAFSPNNDGQNEVFEIDNLHVFPGFRLEIYNRWGSLLFTQTEPTAFWNGKFDGQDMPVATYYYIFSYREGEPDEFVKKGHLTLIR